MADIRSMDGKVRPTISGPMAAYIRDLTKTGLYGNRTTDVARELIRESLCRAVENKILRPRDFSAKQNNK
jgi:Arc/MetJ-type ribon-helix-helix transcriptional regulator